MTTHDKYDNSVLAQACRYSCRHNLLLMDTRATTLFNAEFRIFHVSQFDVGLFRGIIIRVAYCYCYEHNEHWSSFVDACYAAIDTI
jgi:hypothetical protein